MMNENTWKEKLIEILENGCTDSDIEDFINEYPETAEFIWDFVYEYYAPKKCIGCKYIQYSGMFPCNNCSRRVLLKDYYISR